MSEAPAAHGIHHVTALASDPQTNLDFYVGTLGLRMVKKSVNQDDPGTYHLFYADAAGTPGTDVTFFPRRGMAPGRKGTGQVVEIALAVPAGSLDAYWIDRLAERGVQREEETAPFGERTLPFADPDGLSLSLVEIAEDRVFEPWAASGVPVERQIRGVHAVRIPERAVGPTARLLNEVMGFEELAEDGGWRRFAAGEGSGAYAELLEAPERTGGRWGAGIVHHVAWRVRDDEEQVGLRAAVERSGLQPTPVIDRFWFRSVYFREPGGTLFELATDGPGFARDEAQERLGETLVLPPWLEESREEIEAALPALEVPAGG
ncbi:MAG TPA: ring-cleaving dioxygenase [Gemmatimonadota bacterium]|nr:ring-cleaving dioxygenase [Gemmatimonadota bacterium]